MIKFSKNTYFLGGAGNTLCRREFTLPTNASEVTIHILADPHSYARHSWLPLRGDGNDGNWLLGGSYIKFRLFLDGELLGLGPFRPLRDGMGVMHTFTLLELTEGSHVIGVFSRGEQKGFALELKAKLNNGEIFQLKSDSSWQELSANDIYRTVCWESPNIDNFFKGDPGPGEYHEHIDGTLFPDNWNTPEFIPDNWKSSQNYGKITSEFESVDWNYQFEYRAPKVIRKLAPGHFLLDFGQEAIGGIHLVGPENGGTIEVRLAEEMLNNNQVRYQMRTGNCYQERWIFKPGRQRLSHFGLRIFRYAELFGYHDQLEPEQVRQFTVRAPFNTSAGQMQSSNSDLNRIWDLCKYTIQATTMDLYTDCFSRERIAYEADSFITMRSHFAVEGNNTIPAKRTLEYLINHPTWPCEWMQLLIPSFYEYFMHTGDVPFIEKYFDQLIKQCAYINLLHDGLVDKFPLPVIIDWPKSLRDNYDMDAIAATVPNTLVYHNLKLLAEISGWLKRLDQKAVFKGLARKTAAAINQKLFDPQCGLYTDGKNSTHCSFHANMFALWSGVVPRGRIDNVLDFLLNNGMICSLYGAQFLLDVLFRYKRPDEAISMLLSKGNKSWLKMIDNGATITHEVWPDNAKDYPQSCAHSWGSSPANIIVRYIFGLRPTLPGWRKFAFNPQPGPLKHGTISLATPHGTINAQFKLDNRGEIHKSLLSGSLSNPQNAKKVKVLENII